MAALRGLAVHAYCLRPRALPWPFFRPAGPGEPWFEGWACSCYRCQFAVEGRLLSPYCVENVERQQFRDGSDLQAVGDRSIAAVLASRG